MKKLVSIAFLAWGALTASAQSVGALEVKELKLSNGLTVWLNEDHSQPKVYGALIVKAGAKDCPNTGIAHYLEHVLFKGTQKIGTVNYAEEKLWLDSISAKYNELSRTTEPQQRLKIQQDISRLSQRAADYAIPNEFDRLISKYGGSKLNAATSWDYTQYYNTFSPQFLELWCELNSERMLNPVFRLFQGELETVYEEKNRSADDMLSTALDKLLAAVFKGHPYQYPIIGSTENLKNPRLSDMEDFFRRYYVAGNMGLMLSGDFTEEGLLPLLERTFGRLPKGEAPHRDIPAVQPFNGETLNLKVNMPIIKAVGLLFRGPLDKDKDAKSLQLAMSLLTNDNGTGMLDSLRTAHKVMFAYGQRFALQEGGLAGLLIIPKLPFGSKKKAEQLCWQQIERVKRGDFSDAKLEELKLELIRNSALELEDGTDRAMMMGDVYAQGRSWTDYLQQEESVKYITKADVIAAANRYLLTDHYLRGVKKFGSYPKDKVSQPNYKPVVPKHAREQSDYARELAKIPVVDKAPKLVNLQQDAEITPLTSHVQLYKVANPKNDLFTFTLKWHKGERDDAKLILVESYLSELGTDSLTKHQIGEAWQRLGTTFETSLSDNYFTMTLTGFDSNLAPSLNLLRHILTSLKPDKDAMKDLKSEYKMTYHQLDRSNQSVFQMVLQKLSKGDQSDYLRQPAVAEVKKMTGDDLLCLFNDVLQYDCSVLYCGTKSSAEVADLCKKYLPLSSSHLAKNDNETTLQTYSEPTVYFYNMPSSRQTLIGVYGSIKPSLSDKEEAQLSLWSQYMGGGMGSVMFQEIREFRSMAYTAHGQEITPNRARHRDHPSAYLMYLGTQGDKTMQALHVLDSLITQMPVNEQGVTTAKQEILNNVNNNYPSFRQLPTFVSSYRTAGYSEDPHANITRLVPTLTTNDMLDFYRQNIQQQPHIIFIVGNKKHLDMQALSKYGKLVELKKADVLR